MFHTYVTASSGRKVDIDRARYLMDDELFDEVHRELIKTMSPTGFNPFDIACVERMCFPPRKARRGRCGAITAGAIWQSTASRSPPTSIRIGTNDRSEIVVQYTGTTNR